MLPPYIKKQPKFWNYLPILSRQQGSTVLGTIYLKEHIYQNLLTKNPNPEYVSYLLHDEKHKERIKKIGKLRFGIKYLLSGNFRFHEELEASKEQFRYLKKKNMRVDLDRKAKILSSWLYLWTVSIEYSRKEVYKVWEEL